MRIGIDCRMAGTGEGIGRYVEELVKHLSQLDSSNQYYLLCNSEFPISNFQFPNNFQFAIVKSRYYSIAEQTYFIWELLRLRLDLVHFTSFNVPILYPKRFVVTIHDVIHHQFPGRKKSRLLHRLAYRLTIWAAAHRAKAVIAVSQAAKQEIVTALGIRPEKTQVIYEGASPRPGARIDLDAVLKKFQITKPFLLFVGVWRQYKNLPRLAEAFDVVRDKYKIDCQLVLAGKIDQFYPEIKSAVMAIRNAVDVRATGFVSDEDLAVLYAGAKLFVLSSLVEGFGLIGIEAQAAGLPMVAADIPVLHEVLGQAAEYFDPKNTVDIAEKIAKVWQDENLFSHLKMLSLENARRFDWQKTALETLNLYSKFI